MQSPSLIHKLSSIVTPTLMLIIGFMFKVEFNRINAKIDELPVLQLENAVQNVKILNIERRLERLENNHITNTNIKMEDQLILKKPEDEYSITYKNKKK